MTDLPFIGMEHVEAQSGRVIGYGDAAEIMSASPLVEPGDVLYGRLRPYLNKVAIAPERAYTSGEFIVFRSNDYIDGRWLKWRFTAQDFVDYAVSLNAGDRPRVKWPQMRPFKLLLPPIDEQRRIVDILEDHLSRLVAADLELLRLRNRAQLLVRSSLAAGLRGVLVEDDHSEGVGRDLLGDASPLTIVSSDRTWATPETWAWTRLGELFEVNIGATPSRGDASHWDGELPWVSSGEVAFGHISFTKERITRAAAGNPATRIHPPGTVMLAMIGEGKTRGQAAILEIEAAHNQNCASIRVSATDVLPEFVFAYFEERYLETRRGGAGGQQPALNKAAISNFAIPIPPLGTQRRLIAAWGEVKVAVRRLDTQFDVAGSRSDALRRALLAAAFRPRLTGIHADDLSAAEEIIDR